MTEYITSAFLQKCRDQMNYLESIIHPIFYITYQSIAELRLSWRQLGLGLIIIYLIIAHCAWFRLLSKVCHTGLT